MSLFFAVTVVPGLLGFISFPLLAAAFTAPLFLRSADPFKVQAKRPDLAKILKQSLFWHTANSVFIIFVSMASWPLIRHVNFHWGQMPAWWLVILQLYLFAVIDDGVFYLTHRLLHTSWLYRKVHCWHHRVFAPTAFTGAIMHPFEWLVVSSSLVVGPMVTGAHIYVLWMWVLVRSLGNAEFHSGYVGPFRLLSLVPFSGGTAHHDLHHARVKGNYASMFPWWDDLFGTRLVSADAGARNLVPTQAEAVSG